MVGSITEVLVSITPQIYNDYPASNIMVNIIKSRVQRGDSFVFIDFESKIDWEKYDHIFNSK